MEPLPGLTASAPVTGVAWTTVIAAALAAIIGAANLIASLVTGSRQRAIDRRAQWWVRFTWAAEMSVNGDTAAETDLGLTVLDALIDEPEAEIADSELALAIAHVILDNGTEDDVEEGGEHVETVDQDEREDDPAG